MNLTEKQRQDAIAACERIEQANDKVQTACKNLLRILDNCANGRDPKDGIQPIGAA